MKRFRWQLRKAGVIAVDTNIVVRLLTGDHPDQFQVSKRLFQANQVFISDTVILETAWVLRWAYKAGPQSVAEALHGLLGLPNVHFRNRTVLAKAVEWHESGLDFADALHLAQSNHCEQMATFDKGFVNRARDLTTCPVKMLS